MSRGTTIKRAIPLIAMAAISCLVCACSEKTGFEAVFSINDLDKARPAQEEKATSLLKDNGVVIEMVISMTGDSEFLVTAEDGDRARRLIQQGIKDGKLDGSVVKVRSGKKAVTTDAQ